MVMADYSFPERVPTEVNKECKAIFNHGLHCLKFAIWPATTDTSQDGLHVLFNILRFSTAKAVSSVPIFGVTELIFRLKSKFIKKSGKLTQRKRSIIIWI